MMDVKGLMHHICVINAVTKQLLQPQDIRIYFGMDDYIQQRLCKYLQNRYFNLLPW